MPYPSIISQPGSADRNYTPISEALRPWIVDTPASGSTLPPSSNRDGGSGARKRIFEIGSYPYAHIRRFAEEYKDVEWYGSGRDKWEVSEIQSMNDWREMQNLHNPVQLEIAKETDWDTLRSHDAVKGIGFDGVIMFNVIHCCPEGIPQHVFRNLSTISKDGRSLLKPGGWIAVYGPFLADDGSYKSQGDEEFDKTYIKAKHPRLGLRTVNSITTYAEKWGFEQVERKEMPKGNMWVVWRLKRDV